MTDITVDRHDLALLDALQRNAHATNTELGEQVHLSSSQVSRRIQRLEESGLIAGYSARLDPLLAGLGVTAYAHVIFERLDNKARPAEFEAAVAALPEVIECFAVTGEADYILRLAAPDLAAFSDLMMKHLLTLPGVAQIKTNIALKTIKDSHVLPLDHIARASGQKRRLRYAG